MAVTEVQVRDALIKAREKLTDEVSTVDERLNVLETLKCRLLAVPNSNGVYVDVLEFLLDNLNVKWHRQMTVTQKVELYDDFFIMDEYIEDSFVFLVRMVDECGFSEKFDKVILFFEKMLNSPSILGNMFLRQSSNLSDDLQRELRSDLWMVLMNDLVSLPDRIANKFQRKESPDVLRPAVYFGCIFKALIWGLQGLHCRLSSEKDCSTQFMSMLLGRCCLAGNAEAVIPDLSDYLSRSTMSDFIWRRISQRLFSGVPANCCESVITCLFRKCPWYKILSRLLGNSLLDNKKIHFLLTNKLLLIRAFAEDQILHNLIGYLADDETRRKIFVDAFLKLIDIWGNKSSLKHRQYFQHVYMTKAILICIGHFTDDIKEQKKKEILRLTMHAVESHLSNPSLEVRSLGMFTAESIVMVVDPEGPQLNFQYEHDQQIKALKSLLTPQADPGLDDITDQVADLQINELQETTHEEVNQVATNADLDSDDDLEPYDCSNDTVFKKCSPPSYLRDCMAGLIEHNDTERTQVCLEAAERLVRAESVGLNDVAVEMTKILLHLDNQIGISNFVQLRHGALVALAVHRPQKISEYVCHQFYDRNYNLRQRLDILEVLVAAAQELSEAKPSVETLSVEDRYMQKAGAVQIVCPLPTTENWREIIQKRIDAKTRRFAKGPRKPEKVSVSNRFSPVAGYFFYPLVRHYDHRSENTFDLLGSDFYVLGRFIYSLGMILHAAINAPVATQIGKALLDFVWGLRYHVEAYVRQAIIFSICMTVATVPSHALVSDIQDDILDCQRWLKDVVSHDTNLECQQLAMKALMMIESTIKEGLSTNMVQDVA